MRDLGLTVGKTDKLNQSGGVLLGLAKGKLYRTTQANTSVQQAITKLRKALREFTGIPQKQNPFQKYDSTQGYRPQFKLIDSTNLADERAKKNARRVEYSVKDVYAGSSKYDPGNDYEPEFPFEGGDDRGEPDNADEYLKHNED